MAVNFFKALSDDTRLLICLLILHQGELCVCELVSALGLSQPKISRHLALLKEAQFLCTRKHKQWVYYRINEQLPSWQRQVLETTLTENPHLLAAALTGLDNMGARPERQASCCN
ncbi:metalloregulator ArsR/SmtB family transcription factor [Pseudoalteromonas sp. T1lg22]|uniref:metalloregulator ArsR/SmtB family transcription factor n=1 Tax=Pseudoalteromonas sp. T1lg22 TaxID=2077096 RepID=UPI000CF6A4FA|nr:metalloregulator ArsR/SmtB family transcription factor [Pseudoalteromonas sp. T1lg22]